VENGYLKYGQLNAFDRRMIHTIRDSGLLREWAPELKLLRQNDHMLAYERGGLVFVFNCHFGTSLNNVLIPVKNPGEYTVVLSSDDEKYGGFGNVKKQTYSSKVFNGKHYVELYIPARTAFVLKEKVILPDNNTK
jgi:1,4-alpha-glucan branching enzyme